MRETRKHLRFLRLYFRHYEVIECKRFRLHSLLVEWFSHTHLNWFSLQAQFCALRQITWEILYLIHPKWSARPVKRETDKKRHRLTPYSKAFALNESGEMLVLYKSGEKLWKIHVKNQEPLQIPQSAGIHHLQSPTPQRRSPSSRFSHNLTAERATYFSNGVLCEIVSFRVS